ncbi:unnamed protein product [Trichogramma brassicae]|uniref:SprT-like domain-containing protein n=1 Tax=Trichogramma brassicae TaxID=86971 RepID=A0A6H5IBF3_9HYME|nr:unnamed protein product [Trichogramma brassicae]
MIAGIFQLHSLSFVGSFEKGSKKRSSRGRVDEATTSRKRTRPRIIADVTGKDLVDLKLDWPRSMIFKDDDIRVSTMKEETVKGVIDIDSYLIMSTTIRSFNDVAVLTIVNEKLFYKDCENVKALKVLADHVSKMKTNKKLYGGLQFVEGHLANYGDDQIHVVFAVDERATNHIKNLPNYMQFYVNKVVIPAIKSLPKNTETILQFNETKPKIYVFHSEIEAFEKELEKRTRGYINGDQWLLQIFFYKAHHNMKSNIRERTYDQKGESKICCESERSSSVRVKRDILGDVYVGLTSTARLVRSYVARVKSASAGTSRFECARENQWIQRTSRPQGQPRVDLDQEKISTSCGESGGPALGRCMCESYAPTRPPGLRSSRLPSTGYSGTLGGRIRERTYDQKGESKICCESERSSSVRVKRDILGDVYVGLTSTARLVRSYVARVKSASAGTSRFECARENQWIQRTSRPQGQPRVDLDQEKISTSCGESGGPALGRCMCESYAPTRPPGLRSSRLPSTGYSGTLGGRVECLLNDNKPVTRAKDIWKTCFPNAKWPGFTVTMEKNLRSNYGMTHFYKRTVKISSYLHEKLDSEVLDANIAHELIHVYLWSIHSLDPASHDGEFIDWATELEARTPYKNLLTDRESDELIKLVRPQYNWRCRTCGQEKIIHTNHHPSYGYIQHEGACAKPDWILLWEHHPETGSFEKGSKKRSSRGRVDEATTSRKRTRPRIIADVTGKDLYSEKLIASCGSDVLHMRHLVVCFKAYSRKTRAGCTNNPLCACIYTFAREMLWPRSAHRAMLCAKVTRISLLFRGLRAPPRPRSPRDSLHSAV